MISRALIILESSLDERICFTTACFGRSVELVNVCVDERSLDTLGHYETSVSRHTLTLAYINSLCHSLKQNEHVPLVEFMYFVFTSMPGVSYNRRLTSLLLCLCDVFRAPINSLVCWLIAILGEQFTCVVLEKEHAFSRWPLCTEKTRAGPQAGQVVKIHPHCAL